jgi:hypothetical protein
MVYDKSVRTLPNWQPSEKEWLGLLKALRDAKEWSEAVTVMEDYLRRSATPSPRVRLELAQILIRQQQRPARALRVLEAIPEKALPEALEPFRTQLTQQAEQMRADGVLEIDEGV